MFAPFPPNVVIDVVAIRSTIFWQFSFVMVVVFSAFFVVVQSLGSVQLLVTPWTAACQASLSFTVSLSAFFRHWITMRTPFNLAIDFLAILLFIITFKWLFLVRSQWTIFVKSHRIFWPLWPCGLWYNYSTLVSSWCESNHRQYKRVSMIIQKKLFTKSGDGPNLAFRLHFANWFRGHSLRF